MMSDYTTDRAPIDALAAGGAHLPSATSSKDRTQGLAKFRCRSILGIECYKHHLSSRGAWLEKSMLSRRSEFRAFTCPVLRPLIMTSSWQSAFLGTSLFPAEFHKVSVDVPQSI